MASLDTLRVALIAGAVASACQAPTADSENGFIDLQAAGKVDFCMPSRPHLSDNNSIVANYAVPQGWQQKRKFTLDLLLTFPPGFRWPNQTWLDRVQMTEDEGSDGFSGRLRDVATLAIPKPESSTASSSTVNSGLQITFADDGVEIQSPFPGQCRGGPRSWDPGDSSSFFGSLFFARLKGVWPVEVWPMETTEVESPPRQAREGDLPGQARAATWQPCASGATCLAHYRDLEDRNGKEGHRMAGIVSTEGSGALASTDLSRFDAALPDKLWCKKGSTCAIVYESRAKQPLNVVCDGTCTVMAVTAGDVSAFCADSATCRIRVESFDEQSPRTFDMACGDGSGGQGREQQNRQIVGCRGQYYTCGSPTRATCPSSGFSDAQRNAIDNLMRDQGKKPLFGD